MFYFLEAAKSVCEVENFSMHFLYMLAGDGTFLAAKISAPRLHWLLIEVRQTSEQHQLLMW